MAASAEGARVYPSFAELLDADFDLILIDVPIGLPGGQRECDVQARALLGPRRSSIFPAPSRELLRARRYAGQCSLQLWNILDKIREIDALVTPRLQRRVREGHPETSFALLAGAPLRWSKKTAQGEEERRALLAPHFGEIGAARGAARDDVLDAYALLCSARRLVGKQARVLGERQRDERGLRCEIVV